MTDCMLLLIKIADITIIVVNDISVYCVSITYALEGIVKCKMVSNKVY